MEAACRRVGLSVASAYALRRRAAGASFALGWRAATLVARDHVADTLLGRALDGQVDTYTRADGSEVTRHRYDNRLAATLLARLDRHADALEAAPDQEAARIVAQDFDRFLDIVGADAGPARAGLFLVQSAGDPELAPIAALARADCWLRTGAARAGEIDTSDLTADARAGWTAEQWARAEAAGLLAFAAPHENRRSLNFLNFAAKKRRIAARSGGATSSRLGARRSRRPKVSKARRTGIMATTNTNAR